MTCASPATASLSRPIAPWMLASVEQGDVVRQAGEAVAARALDRQPVAELRQQADLRQARIRVGEIDRARARGGGARADSRLSRVARRAAMSVVGVTECQRPPAIGIVGCDCDHLPQQTDRLCICLWPALTQRSDDLLHQWRDAGGAAAAAGLGAAIDNGASVGTRR